MSSRTSSLHEIGSYLYELLDLHQIELGLAAVYYGDQERIPVTPVACVETGTKRQQLAGYPRRVDASFIVYILVYHNPVQDTSVTRHEVEKRAEAVEELVQRDETLGGLVIQSFVSSLEHGYVTKGGRAVRASRLTIEGQGKLNLPASI